MSGEEFAELLAGEYCQLDATFVQHLSMFLNGEEQREGFLDFIGVEYEEDE